MSGPTRRERRRAATVQEILDAAERQVVEVGAHALSLRAVGREVGMTVQALYNYVADRDDLITMLAAVARDDLAAAVEAAGDAATDLAPGERIAAVARAYRGWAVANPARFGLAYGPPVARGPAPGPGRAAAVVTDVAFGHWTPQELAAVPLPDDALALATWGRMHGMVALEVFGHLASTGDAAAALFDAGTRLLVDDLERLRRTVGNVNQDEH